MAVQLSSLKHIIFSYPKHTPLTLNMEKGWTLCNLYIPFNVCLAFTNRFTRSKKADFPPSSLVFNLLRSCWKSEYRNCTSGVTFARRAEVFAPSITRGTSDVRTATFVNDMHSQYGTRPSWCIPLRSIPDPPQIVQDWANSGSGMPAMVDTVRIDDVVVFGISRGNICLNRCMVASLVIIVGVTRCDPVRDPSTGVWFLPSPILSRLLKDPPWRPTRKRRHPSINGDGCIRSLATATYDDTPIIGWRWQWWGSKDRIFTLLAALPCIFDGGVLGWWMKVSLTWREADGCRFSSLVPTAGGATYLSQLIDLFDDCWWHRWNILLIIVHIDEKSAIRGT